MWKARIFGFLLLAFGVLVGVSGWSEHRTLADLKEHGEMIEAAVYLEGFQKSVHTGAQELPHPDVQYSYSYRVQGKRYRGKASGSNPAFEASFKRAPTQETPQFDSDSSLFVGTLTVTYLPTEPQSHEIGVIDNNRAATKRQVWVWGGLGGFFALLGVGALYLSLSKEHFEGSGKPTS